jgi:hypothetical protein
LARAVPSTGNATIAAPLFRRLIRLAKFLIVPLKALRRDFVILSRHSEISLSLNHDSLLADLKFMPPSPLIIPIYKPLFNFSKDAALKISCLFNLFDDCIEGK